MLVYSPRVLAQIDRLAERDGGYICAYCDAPLGFTDHELQPTRDHVIPRSRGGCSHDENMVLACQPCNQSKANAPIVHPAAELHVAVCLAELARQRELQRVSQEARRQAHQRAMQVNQARVLDERGLPVKAPNQYNDMFVRVEAGSGKLPPRRHRRSGLPRCYHDSAAHFCVICSAP